MWCSVVLMDSVTLILVAYSVITDWLSPLYCLLLFTYKFLSMSCRKKIFVHLSEV
uniref:Uncharacterized protein n=1 Tax=Arundo donax TaxID=35708 RepID=A0A0A9FX49_ARUDO